MENRIEMEKWEVTKQLLRIVRSQSEQIGTLFGMHFELVAILRKSLGLPDAEPMRELAVDTESIAKTNAGIAELERMFADDDDETERP